MKKFLTSLIIVLFFVGILSLFQNIAFADSSFNYSSTLEDVEGWVGTSGNKDVATKTRGIHVGCARCKSRF